MVKNVGGTRLIMLYICTKFRKIISRCFRVIKHNFHTEMYKGAYFRLKCRRSYDTCLPDVVQSCFKFLPSFVEVSQRVSD